MKAHVTITEALSDPQLLGAALGDLRSWRQWVTTLKAAFGEKLNRAERRAFDAVAGSRKPPRERVRELWLILGRRSGKSRMAAALAVYVALLTDAASRLAPGERGVVLVLAASKKQAATIRNYSLAFIEASPMLREALDGEPLAEEIRLKGDVSIEIRPNSFRTVRGPTLLACIFDEVAFWRDETSATPDLETYRAVLPALSTTGGMSIGVSSPYRRTGLLHSKFKNAFGKDDPRVLVVNAPTTAFNPMIDQGVIADAERDDREAAQSEWFGEFRSDLNALLDDDVIDGAVDHGRPLELPPRRGITYHCFVDASAGRHDSFTCAVGHAEDGVFIVDALRGFAAPFDPGTAAAEHAALAKSYGITRVTGDAFAGEWVAQAFRDGGVSYETSTLNKSALYLESLVWWEQKRGPRSRSSCCCSASSVSSKGACIGPERIASTIRAAALTISQSCRRCFHLAVRHGTAAWSALASAPAAGARSSWQHKEAPP